LTTKPVGAEVALDPAGSEARWRSAR